MITAAILGCGPRGCEHARALQSIDTLQLIGAVEVQPSRRSAALAEFQVPVYPLVEELLVRHQPHLVVLATPVAARRSLLEAVCRSPGLRALVIEKPMAQGLAEARWLVNLCEEAGIRLVVGHQLRFCPEFVALKEAIDRGQLGRLQALSGWCFGNLLAQGTHLLDLTAWLAGDRKPLWAMSQSCGDRATLERFTASAAPCWDDANHPGPPWMVHHLAFEGGLRVTLETGALHQRSDVFVDDWLQKRLRAVGDGGLAEAQGAGYFRMLRPGLARQEFAGTLGGYQAATRSFHLELCQVLEHGGRHRNDGRDALRSFELLAACAQSAVDGTMAAWPLEPSRDAIADLGQSRPCWRPATLPSVIDPDSDHRLKFSIILPLPDHRGHALDCVRSWTQGQHCAADRYELIVLGNGTEPELEERVRALLRPTDRFLPIVTDNEIEMYHRGATAARGPWLLFTEPHCTAEPECLAELAAYLDRNSYAGACLRSVSGHRHPMARLEQRLFQDGFANWSRPGDWRKVIMRGIALRRDIYHEVGGFEYPFQRFAEWALAATLHSRGFSLGYAAGATVKHYDTANFAELYPAVANFTQGECAYRTTKPHTYCERYFGSPPEWLNRHCLRRDRAREVMGLAWRALWRGGWGHGLRGCYFALVMLREMVAAFPTALFGPSLAVLRAKLGLGLARLRLSWLSFGDEAKYRSYLKLWDAMVHFARQEYLARQDGGGQTREASAVAFDVAELADHDLIGFHAQETWQGRSFRWMGALGTMLLAVPRGNYQVLLDTGGLLGQAVHRPLSVFFNGHALPRAALHSQNGRLGFPVPSQWFVPGRPQTLTLACAPLRTGPAEPRQLGLPVFSVTFAAMGQGEATHRQAA